MDDLKKGRKIPGLPALGAPLRVSEGAQIWRTIDSDFVVKFFSDDHNSSLKNTEIQDKLRRISSDNLLVPTSYGKWKNYFYVAMEACPLSLFEEIRDRNTHIYSTQGKRAKAYSDYEIIRMMSHLTGGLASMHAERLVHLDIKPSNIMLRYNAGEVQYCLSDFDNVRDLDKTIPISSISGDAGISMLYAAPEQILNKEYYGELQTDIYQLGVTLYEAITGEMVPYAGSTLRTELERRKADAAAELAACSVDTKLANYVCDCLSFEKQDRPSALGLYHATKFFLDTGHWPDGKPSQLVDPDKGFSARALRPYLITAASIFIFFVSYLSVQGLRRSARTKEANQLLQLGGIENIEKASYLLPKEQAQGLTQLRQRGYTVARGLRDGLIAVKKDLTWGFINPKGEEVIPCAFSEVSDFKFGYTVVRDNRNRIGVLDAQGKFIINFKDTGTGEITGPGVVEINGQRLNLPNNNN